MNAALSPTGRLLITSFGLGHMRPFPGTWGSLPPAFLALVLAHFGLGSAGDGGGGDTGWCIYHAVLLAVLITFSTICIAYGDQSETAFGKKDPGSVVADETAGMCLPLMFIPPHLIADAPSGWGGPLMVLMAFVLFRIFDIIKPWPCYRLQAIPGGWGILIDDLFAGVYALVCMQLITRAIM